MAQSIWLRQERAGRGPAPEHSRAQLAATGVAIADEGGLAGVSMRRVAARIGTGAASLYRYVENRDELLELMVDAVVGELELPHRPSGDWPRDLVDLAHRLRGLYHRHPWMIDIAPGRAGLGPHAVDVLEYALASMAALDAPAQAKMEAFAMLNGFVVLAVRTEIAVGGSTAAWQAAQAEFLAAVVSAGSHPHLAAAFATQAAGPGGGDDDLIDRVLPRMLAGLLQP
jgi:AcrR family transcriptional regulator